MSKKIKKIKSPNGKGTPWITYDINCVCGWGMSGGTSHVATFDTEMSESYQNHLRFCPHKGEN